jgi:hypothetical protein
MTYAYESDITEIRECQRLRFHNLVASMMEPGDQYTEIDSDSERGKDKKKWLQDVVIFATWKTEQQIGKCLLIEID